MAEPLYEILVPQLSNSPSYPLPPTVTSYLSHLTSLSLSALSTIEAHSVAQSSTSNLHSLQALSSKSHRAVIAASTALSTLQESLPALISSVSRVQAGVPELDEKALAFSQRYSKSNNDNTVLDRRKRAMVLSRNVDRVFDILELSDLLATAISSPSSLMSSSGSASGGVNYSLALDLFAHIKHLHILHPASAMVRSILGQAEEAMKDMTSNLIISLRGQNIRLAAAIRTIGWLRRVAPELATYGPPLPSIKSAQVSKYSSTKASPQTASEASFGYLFLICRLYNILNMLEALAPLRDLADQETQVRLQNEGSALISKPLLNQNSANPNSTVRADSTFAGQQTERYLKRYIEIFREQSFATVSMFKNIFPAASEKTDAVNVPHISSEHSNTPSTYIHASAAPPVLPPFLTLPTPLATFPSHLISLLIESLRQYLPNVTDPSARDSLLMQVLYAAGSLGRLGADFSMLISILLDGDEEENMEEDYEHEDLDIDMVAESSIQVQTGANNDDDDDGAAKSGSSELVAGVESGQKPKRTEVQTPEWIRILKKHRVQSSRLEALSSGQVQTRIPLKRDSSQEAVVK